MKDDNISEEHNSIEPKTSNAPRVKGNVSPAYFPDSTMYSSLSLLALC
jgi:hypothetical protein